MWVVGLYLLCVSLDAIKKDSILRRLASSFKSVTIEPEMDSRSCLTAESLKLPPAIVLTKARSSFCLFFGLRLIMNFSQALLFLR